MVLSGEELIEGVDGVGPSCHVDGYGGEFGCCVESGVEFAYACTYYCQVDFAQSGDYGVEGRREGRGVGYVAGCCYCVVGI